MSCPSPVTDLLTALSYRLRNKDQTLEAESSSSSLELAIANLNQSLTLNSEVSLLDSAISLMCFKAPQVFETEIEYLVRTIVCVLSSLRECRVVKYPNVETLRFGSLRNFEELIEVCMDVIHKLGAEGRLGTLLFQAVVRSGACVIGPKKLVDGGSRGVSKLLAYLPRESVIQNNEIPLRIMFWYQDPLSLKEDVSRMLKDVVERPFVCLKNEFFGKAEWRDIVVCLALSPSMFITTRGLLHKWFLLTGLASVFEFLAGLVSVIMDMISRPSSWGIPMELASLLPFSDAYFPFQCQLLRILAGPLTFKSLEVLANRKSTPVNVQALDDKIEWSLAINFPDWFYFASAMLFSKGNSLENVHHRNTSQVAGGREGCDVEGLSIAAATYIAWILNPVSGPIQESLTKSLIRVSEICSRKSSCSESHISETINGKRRLVSSYKKASSIVEDLIREFHKITNLNTETTQSSFSSGLQSNLLVRRVVLGVLIGSPYSVTDEEYELVLHYAATGKTNVFKQGKGSSNITPLLSTKEEAIEGTRLVFNMADTLESMSFSSFEAEEDAKEFLNQFKLRSRKYLVKCIDHLIQLHCIEDGDTILNDLEIRLLQWRLQGREDPDFSKDFEIISAKLSCIFSFE